jgi:hypothetical protein
MYATPTPAEPTWDVLIVVEPKLVALEQEVFDLPPDRREWTDWIHVKQSFELLVGWEASDKTMRSQSYYHCVYDHLLTVFQAGDGVEW